MYLVSIDNVYRDMDTIKFDGKRWIPIDLVPRSNVWKIDPFVFDDKLLLSVVSGNYLNSVAISDYIQETGKVPSNVSMDLYLFDGNETHLLEFEYQIIKDIVVEQNSLLLLIIKNKQNLITKTTDLKTWEYYHLPEKIEKPMSFEFDGTNFYIGTEEGKIFKSNDMH